MASDLGLALAHRPAVVAFHHDNGVNVDDAPLSLFQTIDPDEARILDRDPLRAEVTYATDDGTLTLTVDEELRVRERDRTDR